MEVSGESHQVPGRQEVFVSEDKIGWRHFRGDPERFLLSASKSDDRSGDPPTLGS